MSPQDQRLAAALMMLHDQIPPIVDEVLAGELDQDERRELARVLATIAAELEPGRIVTPAVTGFSGGASRVTRHA